MKRWLLLFLLLPVCLPAAAQPAPLPDGFTVDLPADWTVADAGMTPPGATLLTNGEVSLIVLTPRQITALYPRGATSDLWSVLAALHILLYNRPVSGTQETAEILPFGEAVAVVYAYETELDGVPGRGLSIIAEPDAAGGRIFVDAFGPAEQFAAIEAEIMAIALSVRLASAGECIVSTPYTRRIRLRIGPGDNRGPFGFMAPNVPLTVLSRYPEPDGDVWVQVDKTQVPDGASAEELWIKLNEVDSVGPCTTVPLADAPDVLPGNPQPTAVPTALPTPEIPVVPIDLSAGSWDLELEDTYAVVCGAVTAFTADTSNLFPLLADIDLDGAFAFGPNRATLLFSADLGDVYTFDIVAPNYYRGGLIVAELALQAELTLVTPELIDLFVRYVPPGSGACAAVIRGTFER